MGGRGASSGMSEKGNEYGSQYRTVLTSGNIKFVEANSRHSESLLETMTEGRVYVTVGGDDLLRISYHGTNRENHNKRVKTIDLNHAHNKKRPHVHHGYNHNENDGPKGGTGLNEKEKKMVERVKKVWYAYLNSKR